VIRAHGGRVASILTAYEGVPEGFGHVFIRAKEVKDEKTLLQELEAKNKVLYCIHEKVNWVPGPLAKFLSGALTALTAWYFFGPITIALITTRYNWPEPVPRMDAPWPPRLKVIGVGNEWRGDDAVGLLAARRLKTAALPRVEVCESLGTTGEVQDAWKDTAGVIVVDAVVSGGPPGAIYRFNAHGAGVPVQLSRSPSSHGWGVAEALTLGRLFQELPPFLIIYGIEGKNFDPGVPGGGCGHPGVGAPHRAGNSGVAGEGPRVGNPPKSPFFKGGLSTEFR
jgi:hydrogenase maturation protease